jgi:gluconolactonase
MRAGSSAPNSSGSGGLGALIAGVGGARAGAGATDGSSGNGTGAAAASAGTAAQAGQGFHCPSGPFESPVPPGATATRVDGFPPADAFNQNGNLRTNLEGPVWIADKLYVSEFAFTPAPPSRILAFDPVNHTVSVALASSGSNGLAVDAAGALIATNHEVGAIIRRTFPLGTPTVLVGSFGGARFDSPNDLAVRSDGTLYFSDPDYQAPAAHPQAKTRLYQLAPGAQAVVVIDEGRSQPNGVTLSADERTLYVSGTDGIYSYPVLADGVISAGSGARINAFNGSSDGMGMDCAGNLYATSGQRIVVLSPAGKEIGSIAVPRAESVTNVAFGGAAHKTLFITSMGSGDQRGVFQIELNVPGFPY